ncbi:alternate-type signal peptide domain-containing protein [Nocardioides sp. GXZ039]|uniref:alternate-type signal peptide domain-containing protein n=1 Tax=Nocardioides sp. GXZ039 TaxID=3136018 RepID=UPI0030F41CDE
MNKNAKGGLAAAAAAVLLLGGAGSLAYWNDAQTISGGTIGAGQLKLDAAACNTAGWTVSNAVEGVTNVAFNPATEKVVPGDVLTKTCNVAITAVGKNLRANLSVTPPTTGAGTTMATDSFNLSGTFTRAGQPVSVVRSTDADKTIVATITLAFPIKTTVDNTSQLKDVNLSAITVTATQATA